MNRRRAVPWAIAGTRRSSVRRDCANANAGRSAFTSVPFGVCPFRASTSRFSRRSYAAPLAAVTLAFELPCSFDYDFHPSRYTVR